LRKNRAEVDPLYTIAHGVFMTLCAVVVIQVMHLIFSEGRLSPTLVLEPHYKLTELVPWINAKDASSRSFPGDHATVLLLFSIFIHAFCGRRYAWIYILVIIFSLPRLVSGAHWFTDVMIGGAATALMVAPLTIVTPIRNRLCQAIYCSIQKIKRRLISE